MVPVSHSLLVRLLQFSLQNALMVGVNHSIGISKPAFSKKVIGVDIVCLYVPISYHDIIRHNYCTSLAGNMLFSILFTGSDGSCIMTSSS